MPKPQPVRYEMDACEIPDGRGGAVCPHEGEWIESMPGIKQGEMRALRKLQEYGPALAALQAPDGEEAGADDVGEILAITDQALSGLIGLLAKRITAWNLTDDFGDPLPLPHGNTEAFEDLRAEQLLYMISVVRELPEELEGNDGSPMQTSSSDSEQPPNPKSSNSEPPPTNHRSQPSAMPSLALQT